MTPDVMEAAPSAATIETPAPIEIPRSGTPDYAKWRIDGTIPDKPSPKTADPAPADTSKETASVTAPAPEPGKSQESRRKPDAEARIRELSEENRRVKAELEEARKPKSADPAPAKPTQQVTRPKPTVEDKGPDGKPKYGTYEEYVEELADWKAEQRIAAREREQSVAQQATALSKQLEEARTRYENYDTVTAPVIQDLLKPDVPKEVFALLNDSPVLADLLYTIGGTEASKAGFLKACRETPGKALRVILLMEQKIMAALSNGTKPATERNESGQFVAAKPAIEAPAKRGPESAPPPPIEIGHRGPQPKDEAERALSEAQKGSPAAFTAWKKAEDAKELRRRRGA